MIVVGAPNSSNSQRLREVAERAGCPVSRARPARRRYRLAALRRRRAARHHRRRLGAGGAGRGGDRRLRRALRRHGRGGDDGRGSGRLQPAGRSRRDRPDARRPLRRAAHGSSGQRPAIGDSWRSTPTSPTTSSTPSCRLRPRRAALLSRASPRASRTRTSSLATEAGQFILTLYEKRVDGGRPALLPRPDGASRRRRASPARCRCTTATGKALGRLAGRPAAIVTFLAGMWVRRPQAEHCAAVGEALARAASRRRPISPSRRTNALSVAGWRPLFEMCDGRADEVAPGLAAEIERRARPILEPAWPTDLPRGRHPRRPLPRQRLLPRRQAVRPDRLLLRLQRHARLRRRGLPQRLVLRGRRLAQRHQGARRCSPPTPPSGRFGDAEIDALPLLARGAALRFLLTRLYDWLTVPAGALVVPKDPLEYYRKLRFHRGVGDAAAYGLDR